MPILKHPPKPRHRTKITPSHLYPLSALVARPVNRAERTNIKKAQDSVDDEWKKLRIKDVWDEDHPREWDDVQNEAKQTGEAVHFGWLFDICVCSLVRT